MKMTFLKLILFLVLFGFVWQSAYAQVDLSIVWQKQSGERIEYAKFSADGNFIYCVIGNTIKKMDAKTGEFISIFDNVDTSFIYMIENMQISNSGNYIVSTDGCGEILVYDTKKERKVNRVKLSIDASCVNITNDDKKLLIGTWRNGIYIYNLVENKLDTIISNSSNIKQIAVSHDGKFFVTGSYFKNEYPEKYYNQPILWDTETLTPLNALQNLEVTTENYGYRLIKFSPDDKYLGCIREIMDGPDIFDLSTKKMVRTSDGRACASMVFLPDSLYYIAVLAQTGFGVYDLKEHIARRYYNTETYGGGYLEVSNLVNREYSIFSIGAGGYNGIALIKGSITDVKDTIVEPMFSLSSYDNGNLIVNIKNILMEDFTISIYDIDGNLKYHEIFLNNSLNPIIINFKGFSGVYFCKMAFDNKEYIEKFEIVR